MSTYVSFYNGLGFNDVSRARDCFYKLFVETEGSHVDEWRTAFRFSLDTLMYYLRGLRSADLLIEALTKHSVSSQCKASLVKMDRCSACAGYNSLRSCKNLCINLLRGCMVDLSDIQEPLTTLSESLVELNNQISSNNFYNRLVTLEHNIFTLIGRTATSVFNIRQRVS